MGRTSSRRRSTLIPMRRRDSCLWFIHALAFFLASAVSAFDCAIHLIFSPYLNPLLSPPPPPKDVDPEEIFSSSFAAAAYLEQTNFKATGKKVGNELPPLESCFSQHAGISTNSNEVHSVACHVLVLSPLCCFSLVHSSKSDRRSSSITSISTAAS